MAMISEARQVFDDWITTVAGAVTAIAAQAMRSRPFRLDERGDGMFVATIVDAAPTGATILGRRFGRKIDREVAATPQARLPDVSCGPIASWSVRWTFRARPAISSTA
jgi:hypothetical protein